MFSIVDIACGVPVLLAEAASAMPKHSASVRETGLHVSTMLLAASARMTYHRSCLATGQWGAYARTEEPFGGEKPEI